MNQYWGDLHNHCAISYGSSTLKRALNNARAHLDFCTITGHAFWPDMPMDIKTQANALRWRCRAVANPAGHMGGTHFNAGGTQAILIDIEANAGTVNLYA